MRRYSNCKTTLKENVSQVFRGAARSHWNTISLQTVLPKKPCLLSETEVPAW